MPMAHCAMSSNHNPRSVDQTNSSDLSRSSRITTNQDSNRYKVPTGILALLLLVTLVVLVAVLFLGYSIIAEHPQQVTPATPGHTNYIEPICQSLACLEAGRSFRKSINFSVNPCDDFYQFACGGWIAKQLRQNITEIKHGYYRVRRKIFKILGIMMQEMANGKQPIKPPVARSVQAAVDLFGECIDRDTIYQRGIEPLKQLLTHLLGTPWPIFANATKLDNFSDVFARFYVNGQISIFETFEKRIPNFVNKSKILMFDRVKFESDKEFEELDSDPDEAQYERAPIKDDQKLIALELARIFAGDDETYKVFQTIIPNLVAFERHFEKTISSIDTMKRNRKIYGKRMRLEQFNAETKMDWTLIINTVLEHLEMPYRINSSEEVLVNPLELFQALSKLLHETPRYLFYNFMGWSFIVKNFAAIKLPRNITMRRGWCVRQMTEELPWAVSRLYVDQLAAPSVKTAVQQLVRHLKRTFIHMLRTEDWLDEATRTKAIEKAVYMKERTSHPKFIFDNHQLDKISKFLENRWFKVQKGKYFESRVQLKRHKLTFRYLEYHNPVNEIYDSWKPPFSFNAFFKQTANSIVIPAASLHPPFFDIERPVYLNYGGLGTTVGHEITHGFDSKGHQLDKNGNFADWWTEETKEEFHQRKRCFIQQYGSIVDKTTGKNLNSELSIGEDIADNGGLRTAFLAYRELARQQQMPRLPLISHFTPDQLFFLSYARKRCALLKPKTMSFLIDNNEHTLPQYRINVPLSNFHQFAEAFNCPVGSPLNPKHKCRLW